MFTVYVRNNQAKQEVSRFVEKWGLVTIVLHEQTSTDMTIIEKIEHYSNDADFTLVLYTARDHGRGSMDQMLSLKIARGKTLYLSMTI